MRIRAGDRARAGLGFRGRACVGTRRGRGGGERAEEKQTELRQQAAAPETAGDGRNRDGGGRHRQEVVACVRDD